MKQRLHTVLTSHSFNGISPRCMMGMLEKRKTFLTVNRNEIIMLWRFSSIGVVGEAGEDESYEEANSLTL